VFNFYFFASICVVCYTVYETVSIIVSGNVRKAVAKYNSEYNGTAKK
jgi:hypothetical protein